MNAVPRFLWNAKMRFGKTFTAYQLAKKLGAKRVLVVTFKPAVEDAWQTDLESHVDFDGWQYLSRSSGSDPTKIDRKKPLVYFGSFQDLLGSRRGGEHQGQERMAAHGELGPGGLRRIPLRRMARDGQGAVRGRGRSGRQEGDQARIRRRPGGVNEDLRSSRRRRPSFCPSRPRPTSISPARRSRRWPRASSSRSRSSTGPTPTSSAPRKSSPPRTPANGTPTARCRRCGC
jgi:hypothetical protein